MSNGFFTRSRAQICAARLPSLNETSRSARQLGGSFSHGTKSVGMKISPACRHSTAAAPSFVTSIALPQPLVDQASGTPHTGIHPDGVSRAVPAAGPAFHAGIKIQNSRTLPIEGEHLVRTDLDAPAATHACLAVQPQSCHSPQIPESSHSASPVNLKTHPAQNRQIPRSTAPTMSGMALRISFFTPERDVNGVQPVKFKAK